MPKKSGGSVVSSVQSKKKPPRPSNAQVAAKRGGRSEVATMFGPASRPAQRGGSHKGINPITAPGNWAAEVAGVNKPLPSAKVASESTPPTPARPGSKTQASKSPNKVTKKESALGKKYAGLVRRAKIKIDGDNKKQTAADRKAIKSAREELAAMRKRLADKGYGKTITTKKGSVGGRGIYKALTGKSARTIKKKS